MEITKGLLSATAANDIADVMYTLAGTRYYAKRPFVKDPRLALLPPDFFGDAVVLDIGCNEGWVTCEIGRS